MKFLYQNSLVSVEELTLEIAELESYLAKLRAVAKSGDYDSEESSINLANDPKVLKRVLEIKKEKVTRDLKYFIVIGIGGSNLGTKAIYDAIQGYFDLIEPERFPKMIFADTIDPEFLVKLVSFIKEKVKKPEEILINVISKSGTTTETIINWEIISKALAEIFPAANDRLVVTTDLDSELWRLAVKEKLARLEIPTLVGGRYSVLSAVGLFPLAASGLDIRSLIRGAREIEKQCLLEDPLKNPAVLSAAIIYYHFRHGKNIIDHFFFHPELESLGKWYRQLVGESLGKEKDLQGLSVNLGLTPTVSIGSTDLHSVGQLYLGGPKDKLTTFVWGQKSSSRIAVPRELSFPGLVKDIAGKKVFEIRRAILEGVKASYKERGLPFLEIILNDLTPRSLGEFLQFKMIEIMFLAKLLNVNAFDQPNVEAYKIATRKILSQK